MKVYPAHGAGSLCGRAISDAPFSLVGQERKLNWAMQIYDRHEFVRQMTANLPDRPAYFSYDVGLNLNGAAPLGSLPPLQKLSENELTRAVKNGAAVIDARSAGEFGAGHFPGSINIGLGSPSFSTWTGFMISGNKPIALVLGSESDATESPARAGPDWFRQFSGLHHGRRPDGKSTLPQISVQELEASLKNDGPLVVDVRTPTEWKSGHIDGARHLPLASFADSSSICRKIEPIAVICGSGYRSSIATSLLQARGYKELANVTGGMTAYTESTK